MLTKFLRQGEGLWHQRRKQHQSASSTSCQILWWWCAECRGNRRTQLERCRMSFSDTTSLRVKMQITWLFTWVCVMYTSQDCSMEQRGKSVCIDWLAAQQRYMCRCMWSSLLLSHLGQALIYVGWRYCADSTRFQHALRGNGLLRTGSVNTPLSSSQLYSLLPLCFQSSGSADHWSERQLPLSSAWVPLSGPLLQSCFVPAQRDKRCCSLIGCDASSLHRAETLNV